jgi:hypothetical protein
MARNGQNLPDGRAWLMILGQMRSGAGSVCSTAISGLEAEIDRPLTVPCRAE